MKARPTRSRRSKKTRARGKSRPRERRQKTAPLPSFPQSLGRIAILAVNPKSHMPEYLQDPLKPTEALPLTGNPDEAVSFADRGAAYKFLKKHPHLQKSCKYARIA